MRTPWLTSLALLAMLVPCPPTTAATINVPDEQPTIQAGIDAASEGDTVLVAPGTYAGESNRGLDFGTKNVVLCSENGAGETVIDCGHEDRGFHFHGGQDSTSIVSGFTIVNGETEAGGGGIYCDQSSPTVADCTFTGNVALYGGAMGCRFSIPSVIGCTFSANTASNGGAVHSDHSSPTFTDCTFSANIAADHGGAMRFVSFCSATIRDCAFTGNRARSGGGVDGDECSLAVAGCEFSENTADYNGGGMWLFCEDSYPTITDCVFSGNTAGSSGGGMCCFGFEPTVAGCVFAGNSAGEHGGGLYCMWYWMTVANCTFFGNTAGTAGGGVYSDDASPAITNTIVSFSASGGAVTCGGSTMPEITRCCIYGNVGAGGDSLCGTYYDNLFADPLFCGPEGDDLRLSQDSPCLPSNSPWGELVGALGVGCEASPVEPTSWGTLKSMFR